MKKKKQLSSCFFSIGRQKRTQNGQNIGRQSADYRPIRAESTRSLDQWAEGKQLDV